MVKHGKAPFLECSSKGDKRFSAFFARIRSRNNETIENIYQRSKVFENGVTGLDWRDAKGKKALNSEEVTVLYFQLWHEYIDENPHLVEVLTKASGLSDIFGNITSNCQATALWKIRGDNMVSKQISSYVCGFIFSHDYSSVWLIKKNRPEWQLGKLNGIGGRLEPLESTYAAMVRECMEECMVQTQVENWILLEEFKHDNSVCVSFFATQLPLGSPLPVTTTDEQIQSHEWMKYNLTDWLKVEAIDNLPYLINKAYCFFNYPESKRMELQKAQDKRTN